MFFKALGREPSAQEASRAEAYLNTVIDQRKTREHLVLTDRDGLDRSCPRYLQPEELHLSPVGATWNRVRPSR